MSLTTHVGAEEDAVVEAATQCAALEGLGAVCRAAAALGSGDAVVASMLLFLLRYSAMLGYIRSTWHKHSRSSCRLSLLRTWI